MDIMDILEESDQFYYQDGGVRQTYTVEYDEDEKSEGGYDNLIENNEDSLLENQPVDNWVQYIDEESGNPYLFNEATGEARWIDLTVPIWERYYDDDGNEYFYNKETQESSWEKPEGFVDNVEYYEYDAAENVENEQLINNYMLSNDQEDLQTGQQFDLDDALFGTGRKSEKVSTKVSFYGSNNFNFGNGINTSNLLPTSSFRSAKSGMSFNPHSPMNNNGRTPTSFSEKRVVLKHTPTNNRNKNEASSHNILERISSQHSLRSSVSFLSKANAVVDNSLKPSTPLKKTKSGFQLLKEEAVSLRRAVGSSGDVWVEWQAANIGPIFYTKETNEKSDSTAPVLAGQWGKPEVFVRIDEDKAARNAALNFNSSRSDNTSVNLLDTVQKIDKELSTVSSVQKSQHRSPQPPPKSAFGAFKATYSVPNSNINSSLTSAGNSVVLPGNSRAGGGNNSVNGGGSIVSTSGSVKHSQPSPPAPLTPKQDVTSNKPVASTPVKSSGIAASINGNIGSESNKSAAVPHSTNTTVPTTTPQRNTTTTTPAATNEMPLSPTIYSPVSNIRNNTDIDTALQMESSHVPTATSNNTIDKAHTGAEPNKICNANSHATGNTITKPVIPLLNIPIIGTDLNSSNGSSTVNMIAPHKPTEKSADKQAEKPTDKPIDKPAESKLTIDTQDATAVEKPAATPAAVVVESKWPTVPVLSNQNPSNTPTKIAASNTNMASKPTTSTSAATTSGTVFRTDSEVNLKIQAIQREARLEREKLQAKTEQARLQWDKQLVANTNSGKINTSTVQNNSTDTGTGAGAGAIALNEVISSTITFTSPVKPIITSQTPTKTAVNTRFPHDTKLGSSLEDDYLNVVEVHNEHSKSPSKQTAEEAQIADKINALQGLVDHVINSPIHTPQKTAKPQATSSSATASPIKQALTNTTTTTTTAAVISANANQITKGKSNSITLDFVAMYARAVMNDRKWPWTSLLDPVSNTTFYRNESDKTFQLETPEPYLVTTVTHTVVKSKKEPSITPSTQSNNTSSVQHHSGETSSEMVERLRRELNEKIATDQQTTANTAPSTVAVTSSDNNSDSNAKQSPTQRPENEQAEEDEGNTFLTFMPSNPDNKNMDKNTSVSPSKNKADKNVADMPLFPQTVAVSEDELSDVYCKPAGLDQEGLIKLLTIAEQTNTAIKQENYKDTHELDAQLLLARLSALSEGQSLNTYTQYNKDDANLILTQCKNIITKTCTLLECIEVSYAEHEINRKYLSNAAMMQRNNLIMPRGVTRDLTAYCDLPLSINCPQNLVIEDNLDSLTLVKESYNLDSWDVYSDTYCMRNNNSSSDNKLIYVNKKNRKLVQSGEPFDLLMRKSRADLKIEKWSDYDLNLSVNQRFLQHTLKIQLLSDPYNGYLFYCPRRNVYSSTGVFNHNAGSGSSSGHKNNNRAAGPETADGVPSTGVNKHNKNNNHHHNTYSSNSNERGKKSAWDRTVLTSLSQSLNLSNSVNISNNIISGNSNNYGKSDQNDCNSAEYYQHKVKPDFEGLELLNNTPTNTLSNGINFANTMNATINSNKNSNNIHNRGNNNVWTQFLLTIPTDSPKYFKTQAMQQEARAQKEKRMKKQRNKSSTWNDIISNYNGTHNGSSSDNHINGKKHNARMYKSLDFSRNNNNSDSDSVCSSNNNNNNINAHLNASGDSVDDYMNSLANAYHNTAAGDGPASESRSRAEFYSVFLERELIETIAEIDDINHKMDPYHPLHFESSFSPIIYSQYATLITLIAKHPDNALYLLQLMELLWMQGCGKEALACFKRYLDILKQYDEHYKQSHYDNAVCHLLSTRFSQHYYNYYSGLENIESLIDSFPESPFILTHAAIYFQHVKFPQVAEQLFVAALLIDPNYQQALFSYSRLLVELGQIKTAIRYLSRIEQKSVFYSLAKLELAYCTELRDDCTIKQNANDNNSNSNSGSSGSNNSEAILVAYKNVIHTQVKDRTTSCALCSLGYQQHILASAAPSSQQHEAVQQALEYYTRSVTSDEDNSIACILLASFNATSRNIIDNNTNGNNSNTSINSNMNSTGNGDINSATLYSRHKADAHYRRGVLLMPHHSYRYIAMLSYADYLCAVMRDLTRADEYYHTSTQYSMSTDIYPTIAYAHFLHYILCDHDKTYRLLLKALRVWHDNDALGSLEEFTAFRYDNGGVAENDNSAYKTLREEQVIAPPTTIDDQCAVLYVAIAFYLIDKNEYNHATRYATAALRIRPTLSTALRCIAAITFNNNGQGINKHSVTNRKLAIRYFNAAFDFGSDNPYTLRSCAVIKALETNYITAYEMLEKSIKIAANCPLSYRILGIMSYYYFHLSDKAISYLRKSFEMSGCEDIECIRSIGQIYLDSGNYKEAKNCFLTALNIVPWDSVSLCGLAVTYHLINKERSSSGKKNKNKIIISSGNNSKNRINIQNLKSYTDLHNCTDPNVLFEAAITQNLHQIVINNRNKTKNDVNYHQYSSDISENSVAYDKSNGNILQHFATFQTEVLPQSNLVMSAEPDNHTNDNHNNSNSDKPTSNYVYYQYALFELSKDTIVGTRKAKALLTIAANSQNSASTNSNRSNNSNGSFYHSNSCSVHIMSIYMLGHIAESENDLTNAELLYERALNTAITTNSNSNNSIVDGVILLRLINKIETTLSKTKSNMMKMIKKLDQLNKNSDVTTTNVTKKRKKSKKSKMRVSSNLNALPPHKIKTSDITQLNELLHAQNKHITYLTENPNDNDNERENNNSGSEDDGEADELSQDGAAEDTDSTEQISPEIANIQRRILLQQRIYEQAMLKKYTFRKNIKKLHVPVSISSSDYLYLDENWLLRALHAFGKCDDWSWLRREMDVFVGENMKKEVRIVGDSNSKACGGSTATKK